MNTPGHPARRGRPPTPAATTPATIPDRSQVDRTSRLFTVDEAAARLRVRPSWLRRKAAARLIPCTFLGKHLRFSPADLAGIIAAHQQPPVGRKPRKRATSTPRGTRDDLATGRPASVHRHDDDHTSNGSSPWPG
jgi:excisionase family DNA binding protein